MVVVRWAAVGVALITLAGCQVSDRPTSSPTTTRSTTTTAAGSGGSATVPTVTLPTVPIQTSGARTVLSPVGLNVRSSPSTTAPIAGSAAEGTVLTVLGHTEQGGSGWYQVMGATVTGYITDDPMLSAGGMFQSYSAGDGSLSALYPAKWTSTEMPPATVVFRPPKGDDSIVVTSTTSVSQLVRGRDGYEQDSDTAVVVCGVTGDLLIFSSATPLPAVPVSLPDGATEEQYLVQVHLTLGPTNALGIDANLADLSTLATVTDVLSSMTFPFPQCEGGTSSTPTSSTVVPSTVF